MAVDELYVAAMFAAGSAAFTASFFLEPMGPWLPVAILLAATIASEALAVRLHHDGHVSLGTVSVVFAALAFSLPAALLVGCAIAVAPWARYSRREPRKLLFNFGLHSMSAFAAGLLGWEARAVASDVPWAALGFGVACGALTFAIESAGVAWIMAMTSHRRAAEVYRANFVWLTPHHLALGAVGGGLAFAYGQFGLGGAIVPAIPLFMSRYSIKQVIEQTRDHVVRLERSNEQLQGAFIEIRSMSEELENAYTGTLETLVAALDVRDQETRGHSVRVARHSVDIAEMLGIRTRDELASIYRGALMHDVGKIGVPDNILLKPGKLSEEEWVFMRKHAAMGYKILAQVPYLRPTARIVLAHHERWDGGGYPRGLKGESIPLGSRIFALCDTFDAIISDRPYRMGQTPEAAFAEILRCAGTQFDPKVVEAFEAIFPRWQLEDGKKTPRPLFLPQWRKHDGDQSRKLAS
jgi:hypothetical protein